jgi:hypothetical protein
MPQPDARFRRDHPVAIARPKPGFVESDYLDACLGGSQGQHSLRNRERGDWQREKVGFRLTELNLKDLRKVLLPMLLPVKTATLGGSENGHVLGSFMDFHSGLGHASCGVLLKEMTIWRELSGQQQARPFKLGEPIKGFF